MTAIDSASISVAPDSNFCFPTRERDDNSSVDHIKLFSSPLMFWQSKPVRARLDANPRRVAPSVLAGVEKVFHRRTHFAVASAGKKKVL